jgi:hypothetical protein
MNLRIRRSASAVFVTHTLFALVLFLFNIEGIDPGCRAELSVDSALYSFSKLSMFIFFSFRIDTVFRDSFLRYTKASLWSLRISAAVLVFAWVIVFPIMSHSEEAGPKNHTHCHLHITPSYLPGVAVLLDLVYSAWLVAIFGKKIYQVTGSCDHAESLISSTSDIARSVSAESRSKSRRLAESMQHHTMLFMMYFAVSTLSLACARLAPLSSIYMALNSSLNIWCLWGVFKKRAFEERCGKIVRSEFCVALCWRCCIRNYDKVMGHDRPSASTLVDSSYMSPRMQPSIGSARLTAEEVAE